MAALAWLLNLGFAGGGTPAQTAISTTLVATKVTGPPMVATSVVGPVMIAELVKRPQMTGTSVHGGKE